MGNSHIAAPGCDSKIFLRTNFEGKVRAIPEGSGTHVSMSQVLAHAAYKLRGMACGAHVQRRSESSDKFCRSWALMVEGFYLRIGETLAFFFRDGDFWRRVWRFVYWYAAFHASAVCHWAKGEVFWFRGGRGSNLRFCFVSRRPHGRSRRSNCGWRSHPSPKLRNCAKSSGDLRFLRKTALLYVPGGDASISSPARARLEPA